MLTGLLDALGGLLSAVGQILGGLLGGLVHGLQGGLQGGGGAAAPDAAGGASAGDTADATVSGVIAGMSEAANGLLVSALSGTDALVETGVADGARALGEMAQGVAVLAETTVSTTYFPDGSVASVTEHVSHGAGAELMMTYVREVLAPQMTTLGDGVQHFMLQTGTGVGQTLDTLSDYDLSYASTAYGTTRLTLEHG